MRLLDRKNRSYFLIVFGNLIPVIGIVGFDWNMNEAFLFYAAEICAYELVMIPKIIIHTYTKSLNSWDFGFKKIMKSFAWILYHLMMFGFALMFMIHTAFAISAGVAFVTWQDISIFINENYLVIIYIAGEYLFVFFNEFIRMKEYKVLPAKHLEIEIALFYLILLAVIGLINGFSAMLQLDSEVYQIIMLIIVVTFKTIAQSILKKRKDNLYSKHNNS